LPPVNVVTARLPNPFDRVAVPTMVVPSLKVTLPVTVPDPGGTAVTVADKLMDWPDTEGFGEAVKVVFVVIAAALTICVILVEVLLVKLASPA